ncbi:MAG: hypothetical protein V4703_12915 [Actinomycetota bacterium]
MVLRDLGLDVTTVDPDPSMGADHAGVPRGRFDVVCVATPIAHLADEAARWVGFEGHLLIEKPAAASNTDARELAALLVGQRVAVGYVERFNPCVRAMARALADAPPPVSAVFRRWNDRPATDVRLDLTVHDIDLAGHLGLACPVRFDTRAGSPVKAREITVRTDGGACRADLTAHDTSPLHAQWHAFLSGRAGCASLKDAVRVLAAVDVEREVLAA